MSVCSVSLTYQLPHLLGQDDRCAVVTLREYGLKHLCRRHQAVAFEGYPQSFDILVADIDVLLTELNQSPYPGRVVSTPD